MGIAIFRASAALCNKTFLRRLFLIDKTHFLWYNKMNYGSTRGRRVKMVEISNVNVGSHADKAGIKAGDILKFIDGNEINDVLDYRFFLASSEIRLTLVRDGKEYETVIKKGEYDDIGLGFERPLMDKKHSCENKCVFCFIDQLPRGMRKTLYFKDDDSRLSFLHGNYVTLTNLHDHDVERIIKMHISPVNVSVHTTNPELRREMMHNKRAGEVLAYLDRFAEAGISICAQIVLCKGLNDGAELIRSMHDLTKYYPSLVSCSIVPAGLTKFREKLYPLSPYNGEECGEVIDTVEKYASECYEKFGTHLFFCSDEFYIKSGRELPPESYYEGYPQIENGVGMITSLKTEVGEEMEYFDEYEERLGEKKRVVSIATGVAAYDCIKELAEKVASETGGRVTVHVYKIINRFFGENITVSGLLTATDMAEQLVGKELGDELLIPHNALKADEDIFLDDVTLDEFSKRLGVKVTPAKDSGAEFVSAVLGLE